MKTEFEYPSDKNALPMHRYAPHKLKYQIVIDVVEGHWLGHNESRDMYYVWKVTRVNDNINKVEALSSFKEEDKTDNYRDDVDGNPYYMSYIIQEWGRKKEKRPDVSDQNNSFRSGVEINQIEWGEKE